MHIYDLTKDGKNYMYLINILRVIMKIREF